MPGTLTEILKEKQEERGENQAEFAAYLGISQSTLSRIYNNDRRIGRRVLSRVLIKYPDLASFFVSEYVNQGQTNVS